MITALLMPVWFSYSAAEAAQGYEIIAWGSHKAPNAPLRNITTMAAGSWHSLALKADGSIIGWGYDGDGQATPPGNGDHAGYAVFFSP